MTATTAAYSEYVRQHGQSGFTHHDSDACKALLTAIDSVIAGQADDAFARRDALFVFRQAPPQYTAAGRARVRCLWASAHAWPINAIEHNVAYFSTDEIDAITAHGTWHVIERDDVTLPPELLAD